MKAFARRHPWLIALALLPLPALCAAGAPAGKTELVVGTGGDVQRLDPHIATNVIDITVTFNIFDKLVQRGQDLKLQPALATEWKRLNDNTWQFKLRRGVKFHNGEPFNAETVKFSLGRTLPTGDPKIMTRGTFLAVDRIDVVDEYTINIVTTVPDPLIPDRLAFHGGTIIPKQYFEKVGAEQFNLKPVGTGPLKFVEWVKDDHVTLEANKEWWGGKIAFERVTFRPIPEAAARVSALLKGEADIITRLPPDDVDWLNKSPKVMAVGVPLAGLYVLATNYKRPFPMDNKYFHQALSLAIDRQAIVKNLWRGQGVVPNGVYPKGNWAYDPSLPPLEYSKEKAKALLKQIGYKGEEVIMESTIGFFANERQMSEAVVEMWREVGINAKLEIIEFSVRGQKNRERSFKGIWFSDPIDTLLDPDGMVWRLQGPGTAQDYLRVPEWDKLMDEARISLNHAKRKANYDAAHKIYLEYLPWIPVIQPIESYGVQRFLDWKPRPTQDFMIQDVKLR